MKSQLFIDKNYPFLKLLAITLLALLSASSQAQELNPKFFYYVNGKVINGWALQVSDADDWGGAREVDFKATSAGGKVELSPGDYVGKGDAVNVVWNRKKKLGQFSVYGPHTDLSSAKDVGAIAFDLKIERAPNKGVDIIMDCGWPCRAQFNIGKNLRKARKKQWFTMPIPLNCFASDNFDLSKINGPLILSTEGSMEITIANIRIERLPDGDTGCAAEN